MSSSTSTYPPDPGYGRVGDLCAYLGYTERNGERLQKNLRDATVTYRINFIANTSSISQFPTDEDAHEARECARGFLEAHQHLFQSSETATSSGFPAYPEDRNRIINALTRLMCQQEFLWRKNQWQKSREIDKDKNKVISEDDDYCEGITCVGKEQTSRFRNLRPGEDRLNRAIETIYSYIPVEDAEGLIPRNCYPTKNETQSSSNKRNNLSEFGPEKGAPTPKRQKIDSDGEISTPATIVVEPRNIEKDPQYEDNSQQSALLFLTTANKPPRSTPLELETTLSVKPACGELVIAAGSTPSAKRKLIVKLFIPSSKLIELFRPDPAIARTDDSHQQTTTECSGATKTGNTREISNSGCWTPIEPKNTNLIPQSADCKPTIATASISKADLIITHDVQEGVTKTEDTCESMTASNIDIKCCSPTFPGVDPTFKIRSKPVLQFMFQRPDGRPNRKNLVPRHALLDMSLSDIFAAVSSQTKKPLESLACITLRYLEWGEGEALVVQRTDGEDEWNDIKEEVDMVFKDATREYPNKKEFLVWIKCGDRTKMEKQNSDGED